MDRATLLILAGIDGERVRSGQLVERIDTATTVEGALEVNGDDDELAAVVRFVRRPPQVVLGEGSDVDEEPAEQKILNLILLLSIKDRATAVRIAEQRVVFAIGSNRVDLDRRVGPLNRTICNEIVRRLAVMAKLSPDGDGSGEFRIGVGTSHVYSFAVSIATDGDKRSATLFRRN